MHLIRTRRLIVPATRYINAHGSACLVEKSRALSSQKVLELPPPLGLAICTCLRRGLVSCFPYLRLGQAASITLLPEMVEPRCVCARCKGLGLCGGGGSPRRRLPVTSTAISASRPYLLDTKYGERSCISMKRGNRILVEGKANSSGGRLSSVPSSDQSMH